MHLEIPVIVFFLTMASTAASNHHLICKSVNDVFADSEGGHVTKGGGTTMRAGAQGRPGKVGPVGPRGLPGVRGLKGEAGNVDYNNISEIIERKVCEGLSSVMTSLNDMRQEVASLRRDVKAILCSASNLLRDGICYRATNFTSSRHLNREEAKLACRRIGFELAKIRDQNHQAALENLVRPLVGASSEIYFWIDLIYNHQTSILQYESGEKVLSNQITWYPGYPNSDSGRRYVMLGVKNTGNDGIWNLRNYDVHGALCEKKMTE